jgi:hypothetical protein
MGHFVSSSLVGALQCRGRAIRLFYSSCISIRLASSLFYHVLNISLSLLAAISVILEHHAWIRINIVAEMLVSLCSECDPCAAVRHLGNACS